MMHTYSDYPVPPYYVESSNNDASSSSSSSSSFYPNIDFPCNHDEMKMSRMIRWNSGKRVDPGLLGMLELFGDIYVERHEFFNKIFHGDHEEVFKKIGHALKKKKSMKKTGSMNMKRSMSMSAIRQRGLISKEENEFRVQRFKIRTPNVIEAQDYEQDQNQPTEGPK